MFSFGVVLFEVLCGRRAFIPNKYEERSLQLTKKRFGHFNIPQDGLLTLLAEEGKLDDMINSDLRKQMEDQSYKIFSNAAYYCLNEDRVQRPDVDNVIKRLEKALELQYKYDHSGARYVTEDEKDTSSNHTKAHSTIAKYSFLSRNPPAVKQLPFLFDNTPANQNV
ncbi:hypothetical protein L1987_55112 [Smallanthus sonchifolius]|uniref:Uncharacterized protein n=1 Tax=Smallanthus sonchifolius TaxID=185202 RepID=A0ACB9E9E2_9ASTR|nr:hypothetical protein L1987_55112 [Smallanthus sonchifolius]